MADVALGPWHPFTLDELVEQLAAVDVEWWISGGHALELAFGRSWRAHDDVDISTPRRNFAAFAAAVPGWEFHVAAGGVLTPWTGEPLRVDDHQNNVWVRTEPGGPWRADITIADGDADEWIFRRDPTVRRPWSEVVRTSSSRMRYLAPHVQMLYKSRGLRPKDDLDAQVVIPLLDATDRAWLLAHLPADHPWQRID